jgi:hypothetical protein
MLDSPGSVYAGQAGFEYPATYAPFSSHQQRQAHVLLGEMGERRMAELVKRPPTRGLPK